MKERTQKEQVGLRLRFLQVIGVGWSAQGEVILSYQNPRRQDIKVNEKFYSGQVILNGNLGGVESFISCQY